MPPGSTSSTISKDMSVSSSELLSPFPVAFPSSLDLKVMEWPLILIRYSAAVFSVPSFVLFALEPLNSVSAGTRTGVSESTVN